MYRPINFEYDREFKNMARKSKIFSLLSSLSLFLVITIAMITLHHHTTIYNPHANFKQHEGVYEEIKPRKQLQQTNPENLNNTIYYHLKKALKLLTRVEPFSNISKVKGYKELPICVVTSSKYPEQIFNSFQDQNYSNYKFVYRSQNQLISNEKAIVIKPDQDIIPIKDQILLYSCKGQSIVLLAGEPLKNNSLSNLNTIYQQNNAWLTYHKESDQQVSITSFYSSLFLSLKNNDFSKSKIKILRNNVNFLLLSLFELSPFHSYEMPSSLFFESKPFLHTDTTTIFDELSLHLPYQPMYTLSQNYIINDEQIQRHLSLMKTNKNAPYAQSNGISQKQMFEAIQYLELKNLPVNHSLFDRNNLYYQEKYQLSKENKELWLCVLVLNHNTIMENRYRKVLQTIFYQNYTNYHVVFMDDGSSDETYTQSKLFANNSNKVSQKIEFVKNKERKHFAFNLNHAANNYCKRGEILIILDGNDELVGQNVFRLFNSMYQRKQNWLVYTNYFTSNYTYGFSKDVPEEFFVSEKRSFNGYIGPITTLLVDLQRKVKEDDLKDMDGRYIETALDETLKYPLLEMTGKDHAEYLPELCYYSKQRLERISQEMLRYEKKVKKYIEAKPRYAKVKFLFGE